MTQGPDCFGPQYGVMYRNDTHADDSVDRVLFERMIKLDKSSVEYLYSSHTDLIGRYENGSRASLEKIVARLQRKKGLRNGRSYCCLLPKDRVQM